MTEFVQYLISGVASGSIYGLVALGFVLVLKSTDVFNFAHGDLLMLGAYLMVSVLAAFTLPLAAAMVVALAGAALLGLGIQQVVLRPMVGRPLLTVVMVTIALSLIIRSLVIILWGPNERTFTSRLPSDTVQIGSVRLSELDLMMVGIALACVLAFALFFRFSKLGLQMRATADNHEAAALSGVDANRVFAVAFAIGTATAAIGGILLANLLLVTPALGEIGLVAVPAAVIGGLRSIPGAIVGGYIVGILEQLSAGYIGTQTSVAIVYAALLVVLLIRPYGLFGTRDVVRV